MQRVMAAVFIVNFHVNRRLTKVGIEKEMEQV